MNDLDGILLIDKPAGMSSFGVVARVRRVLSRAAGKKVKVGHTGTLDPFATGLLILVIGKACRQAGRFSKLDKVYEATIILGRTSTTGDPEGDIEPVSDKVPSQSEISEVLRNFTGRIEQTPPAYSAIKIDGQRAYKLARAGKEVEIPTRLVEIEYLDILDYRYPELRIRTKVSSGTYIRSLAGDIGQTLGTGAFLGQLRRTSVGDYDVDSAVILDENARSYELLKLD